MKLIYFAWVSDKIGHAEETLAPPANVATVGDLVAWLATVSPGHAAALADMSVVRCAVNQEYVDLSHPLATGDEVAFFPPVTGG